MAVALVNGRVLGDDGILEGRAVLLEGGRIVDVVSVDDPRCRRAARHDLGGHLLLPGFLDTQVNGGGGVLFNAEPSVDAIRAIGEAHRRFGTTGFLPTLISDDLEVVARALEAVRAAMDAGVPGVLGIHIEGPYLNVARKGVHNSEKLRGLDESAIDLLTSLRNGKTLVTLAPEMTTPGIISKLASAGVVVSAGHTNATYGEIRAALRHGLTGFTHLFNAMSQLTARAPGVVGAALEDAESWCGIIVDGRHVDPAVLRIALRCKRRDRFMLVTDAMPSVGAAEKSFSLQGRHDLRRGRRAGRRGRHARGLGHRHGDDSAERSRAPGRGPARGCAHGQPVSRGVPGPRQRARQDRAGLPGQSRTGRRRRRRQGNLDRRPADRRSGQEAAQVQR